MRKVLEKTKDRWIPEDVYHAIKSGQSVLHLVYEDQDYAGFTVSTPLINFDGKVLHLWIVYNDSKVDIIKNHIGKFEQMGRNLGARRITFWSPRNWERRLAEYGFKPAQTEFVKEI